MTIEDARKEIISSINNIYEKNEADNIAEIVMEHITRWSRIERVLNKDTPLSSFQKTSLNQTIDRLQQHEPIQYIINEAWFAGMRFYVDKSVLIPRPETEELVEWILKEFRIQNSEFRILDVGTGSGCIAIALKKKLPNAEVWACDVSDEALTVARMNADALNTAIDFVPLNFLDKEQRKQLPEVDIIVSNPPYVPQKEKNEMRKNVADHEPFVALFVPDSNPLVFYEAIAEFGKEKLTDGGKIYVEIHENLGEQVKQLFQSKAYNFIELKKDLQGKDRMIKVVFNS
ncbi:MAG TPA: peptide chain release factor N(5)-glutamine methyltransferase [Chitinophagaceae bacterium]|jgi:release factor glutamine methyltransferase|nr:peptide chain release factor N(5)-glutamine methyltransferase [Chitinophagaceae bacterium]